MLFRQKLIALFLLMLLTLFSEAQASTATGTLNVTLTITSVCSVTASNMAFSSMPTGTTTSANATSTITVNCSNGAAYTVALDNGQNVSSSQRRMRLGATSNYINYNIYSDSGYSVPWATLTGQTGSGSNQTITAYGNVPSAQAIATSGAYADQVTVTISY